MRFAQGSKLINKTKNNYLNLSIWILMKSQEFTFYWIPEIHSNSPNMCFAQLWIMTLYFNAFILFSFLSFFWRWLKAAFVLCRTITVSLDFFCVFNQRTRVLDFTLNNFNTSSWPLGWKWTHSAQVESRTNCRGEPDPGCMVPCGYKFSWSRWLYQLQLCEFKSAVTASGRICLLGTSRALNVLCHNKDDLF